MGVGQIAMVWSRWGHVAVAVVVVMVAASIASDIESLEDAVPPPSHPSGVKSKKPKNAQKPKCDPKTLADIKKAEKVARAKVSAQPSPKSAAAALAKKANELSSKLKKMEENPACKKLAKKTSPQKKATKKAVAATDSAASKKQQATDKNKEKNAKTAAQLKEKTQKSVSSRKARDQEISVKQGGQERLDKEAKTKADEQKKQAIAHTVARQKIVFRATMEHMKVLHDKSVKELAQKTQERLATLRANFATHAEEVMKRAKERGNKEFLPPAARKESRFKAKERNQKEEKHNKKHTERFTKKTLRMAKMKETTAKKLAKDLEKGTVVYTSDFMDSMAKADKRVTAAEANKMLLKMGFRIGTKGPKKTPHQRLMKAKASVALFHDHYDKHYGMGSAAKKKLATATAHAARKTERQAAIAVPGAKGVAKATKIHKAEAKHVNKPKA